MVRRVSLLLLLTMSIAHAHTKNVFVREIVVGWHGDPSVQFFELAFLAKPEVETSLTGDRVDVISSDGTTRSFDLDRDVTNKAIDSAILFATAAAVAAGLVPPPDVQLAEPWLDPVEGSVCYVDTGETDFKRCLRYTGGDAPIDLSLNGKTGPNNATGNESGMLSRDITPTNNAGTTFTSEGSCWSDTREPWETCDGEEFSPTACPGTEVAKRCRNCRATCTSCGDGVVEPDDGEECDDGLPVTDPCPPPYGSGTLSCRSCRLDTSKCSLCGNGVVDTGPRGRRRRRDAEQCDGADLAGATCDDLGYRGGTLACDACRYAVDGCNGTFYVPGGVKPSRRDCLGAFFVTNDAQKPGPTDHVANVQRCVDGDHGCDADATADGKCQFSVGVCVNRSGGTLRRPARCDRAPIRSVRVASLEVGDALMRDLAGFGTSKETRKKKFTALQYKPPLSKNTTLCTDAEMLDVGVAGSAEVHVWVNGRADVDVLTLSCSSSGP